MVDEEATIVATFLGHHDEDFKHAIDSERRLVAYKFLPPHQGTSNIQTLIRRM